MNLLHVELQEASDEKIISSHHRSATQPFSVVQVIGAAANLIRVRTISSFSPVPAALLFESGAIPRSASLSGCLSNISTLCHQDGGCGRALPSVNVNSFGSPRLLPL